MTSRCHSPLKRIRVLLPVLLLFPIISCGPAQKTIISRSGNIPTPEPPPPAVVVTAPQAALPQAPLPPPPPAAPIPQPAEPSEPVTAPPDLAAWALENTPKEIGPAPVEEAARDDFNELVSPFDEKLIEEMTSEKAPPEEAPKAVTESPLPQPEPGLKEAVAPQEQAAPPPEPAAAPAVTYDIPIDFNKQVLGYIELFRTVRRQSFERGLVRSKVYEKVMRSILAEERVPQDLYYLCLIESAYYPQAYSRARAMGPWQFIESTGRLYNLNRDWWVDERRDPEKATRAAARHLRDLRAELGSWPLALAAYNAGQGYIKKVIASAGTADFWSLRLVSQTKNYVPAFMAAVIIAKEPEKYGFFLDYVPPLEYERVTLDSCTNLDVVAECAGCSVDEIRKLNPELLRWCTPPVDGQYSLAVPKGCAGRFGERYAQIPRERKVSWKRHKIVPGDTLSGLSQRYGTGIPALLQVNNLRITSLLRVGDYLIVPIPGGPNPPPESETSKVAALVSTVSAEASSRTRLTYRVRPGDTLWDIAQRHGITVEELRQWNPQVRQDLLHTGDLLTVWSRQAAVIINPVRETRPQVDVAYQVRRGDTLWSIARRFETAVDEICRVNGFDPSRTLMPGERITIPGGNL